MDPFVAIALFVRRALTLGLGTAVGLAAGVAVVLLPADGWRSPAGTLVAGALACSLSWRVYRRFGRIDPSKSVRREVEIAAHVVPLVYGVVQLSPGGFTGQWHALTYLMMMSIAAFFASPAAAGALTLSIAHELAIAHRMNLDLALVAVHAGLLVVFAVLNWVVFRGEIRRVRRLSKQHLEGELLRIKQAARDYRLTGVPRSAADGAADGVMAPPGDEERLLRSSLDHLQASLRFVLSLLRHNLGARTAALYWLGADGQKLTLREASSAVEELAKGPFSTKEGLFAAALSSGQAVSLHLDRARGRMPLYGEQTACGGVTAIAVTGLSGQSGVLLLEFAPGFRVPDHAPSLLSDAAEYMSATVENERLFLALQRAKTEQGKLYQAADRLAEARSEAAVIRAGVESARQFASFDFAAVTLHHRSDDTHEICAVSGSGAEDLVGQVFSSNTGLVSMVVTNQHPLPYRGEYHRSRHVVFSGELPLPDLPSLIILPLKVHDSVLGTLVLGSESRGAFGESVRPTLEVLARHVAVSLANARLVKRLEDLATTDGLTQLLNKRALIEIGRQKIRSAQRFDKPLSVIVGDIDHFKRVNDEYGHDVGDVVIKGFADVLRRTKRSTDAVARFGGEEFVIVCEETDQEGARLLAERVRSELAAVNFHTPQGTLSVTCSLGVATLPGAGTEWDTLFKATDEALYVSKRGGRNRVTVWAPKMRGAA